MKTIVFAGQKGGIGKSTIACNIAVKAVKSGKNTLIVDGDPQGSSMGFRAIRETEDLKAVSITQPKIHQDVEAFSNFDLVIVDAGGRDNTLLRSAIMAAANGILVIPVLPSAYDIWATEDTFKILSEARVYKPIKAYAVFNRTILNTKVAKEAQEELNKLMVKYNIDFLNTVLYNRVDYSQSIGEGQGVIEYNPEGKAAEEINALYNEIANIMEL
jgi:ATPases involved in chromosome partitioning